jgi:hypothetical protein
MQSSGPETLWGFSASAEYGVSPDLDSLLERQESILFALAMTAPTPQSPVYSEPLASLLSLRRTDDMADAMHYALTLPPKEPEMNEIMLALEAMIRRVVTEELSAKQLTVPSYTSDSFRQSFKEYVRTEPAEFSALTNTVSALAQLKQYPGDFAVLVQNAVLDKPWFDDAVKSEVSSAMYDIPAAGNTFGFGDKDSFDKYIRDFVREDCMLEDWFNDTIQSQVERMDFSAEISVR